MALRKRNQVEEVHRTADPNGVAHERRVFHAYAGRLEHGLELFAHHAPGAHDHRRLPVVGFEQRPGFVGSPPGHPAGHQPARMRELGGQRVDGVGGEVRAERRPFAIETAKHGVDELACTHAVALLGQFDRLGDGGVGRHAPHFEQLLGAQPDQVGEVAVESGDAAAHAARQGVVDPAATPEHAVHQLLRPPAVARVQLRAAALEGKIQQAPRAQVGTDIGGGPAGVGDRGC